LLSRSKQSSQPEVVDALLGALDDPKHLTTTVGLLGHTNTRDPRVHDTIASFLTSPERNLRFASAQAFLYLEPNSSEIQKKLGALLADKDGQVARMARQALEKFPPA